mmetsp:Transcript_51838/g.119176  ORF Transcript_51838/g.119176 Transcript_51838/m.119176 type:complete len:202 (-) Transcript_51838:169-774(-)
MRRPHQTPRVGVQSALVVHAVPQRGFGASGRRHLHGARCCALPDVAARRAGGVRRDQGGRKRGAHSRVARRHAPPSRLQVPQDQASRRPSEPQGAREPTDYDYCDRHLCGLTSSKLGHPGCSQIMWVTLLLVVHISRAHVHSVSFSVGIFAMLHGARGGFALRKRVQSWSTRARWWGEGGRVNHHVFVETRARSATFSHEC